MYEGINTSNDQYLSDYFKFKGVMKTILKCAMGLIVSCCMLISCSDDMLGGGSTIIGTWSATHTYNNPVSGKKYQYSTVVFNENKTGTYTFDGPSSFGFGEFSWSKSGNVIKCKGSLVYSDGYADYAWEPEFKIEGSNIVRANFVYHKH